jgi:hypothetical protein
MSNFIDYKDLIQVSYTEFQNNFGDYKNKIFEGYIYQVKGNPYVAKIKNLYIDKWIRENKEDLIKENTKDLFHSQELQRALFNNLTNKRNILVDSTVRLRATKGKGAFVGPHVDKYEYLSEHCINFWVSFLNLEENETITFVKSNWIPNHHNQGNLKLGVKADKNLKFFPVNELIRDSISYKINAGDYFVFASGKVPHCSPFFVKKKRISADQRLLFINDTNDTNFAEIKNYYFYKDLENITLHLNKYNSIERFYLNNTDLFMNKKIENLGKKLFDSSVVNKLILEKVDPLLLLQILKKNKVILNEETIKLLIDKYNKTISILLLILENTDKAATKYQIFKLLIKQTPENPTNFFKPIFRNIGIFDLLKNLSLKKDNKTSFIFLTSLLIIIYKLILLFNLKIFNSKISNKLFYLYYNESIIE